MEEALIPGSHIKCKIVGCLETSDSNGDDPKLIAYPISSIDPSYNHINNITDIPEFTLEQIKYFFSHYKDLENKKVIIGKFIEKKHALQIYKDSIINYKNKKK